MQDRWLETPYGPERRRSEIWDALAIVGWVLKQLPERSKEVVATTCSMLSGNGRCRRVAWNQMRGYLGPLEWPRLETRGGILE